MSNRKRHGTRQETNLARSSSSKNIVVFGESGIGKSSLINQIAGRSIAATSSSARGCTFQHQKYEFSVDDGTSYTIWDTSGLDEGTYGTVPAEIAEENLKHLLRDLTRANGVHLLVYCVRGTRLRQTLLSNYNLFYSAICRKKVPIVAIVTGLENYEEEMEDWWTANQSEFAKLKMHFDGHACVTTLNVDKVNSPVLKKRCHESRTASLNVITSALTHDRWGADSDGWISTALADVRTMIRSSRRKTLSPLTPIVAMYDLPENPLRFSPQDVLPPPPFEGGQLVDIGGSPHLVYRIRDSQLSAGTRFKKQIAPRGADLLIFCAPLHAENTGATRRRAEEFYRSYGGDTRPLLVIVRDAPSDDVAFQRWNASGNDMEKEMQHRAAHSRTQQQPDTGRMHAIVHALPPLENPNAKGAIAKLRHVIEASALQPLEDVPSGCFGRIMGRRRPPMRPVGAAFEPDSLARARVWSPWHHDTMR